MKFLIFFLIGMALFFHSCIKDEPLNKEADITQVRADEAEFLIKPTISNNEVLIYLKPGDTDLSKFKLDFELTPGATIYPASGEIQDFSQAVNYTVTSENREFSKKYTVRVVQVGEDFVPTEFNFEETEVDEDDNFTVFFNTFNGQRFNTWSSGNSAFAISLLVSGLEKTPEAYPTSSTKDSHSGEKALLLETKFTGSFGAMFKKPIAAGNLFIGNFDPSNAVVRPLEATEFGLPFNKEPLAIEGYYKYKAGAQMKDENMKNLNAKDSCDIYAVLYNRKELLSSDKVGHLNGNNIFTHKSIAAIARLNDGSSTEGDGFVKFRIPFSYSKQVDRRDIELLDYNITIVFSSSKYGDKFHGAIGSQLIVDDVKIITK